ncbi:hypothetical protein BJ508DRAFT_152985 [Ascobolus immersus RN42]|uniref:Uncharacterized protein n=1 Tax=Ascobolus immersus RN42 TaxID=1160509 RepID=A0A3N4IA77_ASCIM|nr:hypothetical protein BJ508DRAFT_152985 [Ascobolus immersus RN42]
MTKGTGVRKNISSVLIPFRLRINGFVICSHPSSDSILVYPAESNGRQQCFPAFISTSRFSLLFMQ